MSPVGFFWLEVCYDPCRALGCNYPHLGFSGFWVGSGVGGRLRAVPQRAPLRGGCVVSPLSPLTTTTHDDKNVIHNDNKNRNDSNKGNDNKNDHNNVNNHDHDILRT